MMRINEFRRIGVHFSARSVRANLYGTLGAFEEQADQSVWVERDAPAVDVEPVIKCANVYDPEKWAEMRIALALKGDFSGDFAEIHKKYRSRLPECYKAQPSGHEGSHQFLTDDFITAVTDGKQPSCSIWDAARFNAPGIVAHESAKREGELMKVPDFGVA
jgi:hypothetical protein